MTVGSLLRRVFRLALAVVVLLLIVFGGLLLWPKPGGMDRLSCAGDRRAACRVVSGRVVYALQKDRHDRTRALHLVLASGDSLSGPGISIVKIPPALRPANTPRFGAWVSVLGVPHKGSNGERDMTADRIAKKSGNG